MFKIIITLRCPGGFFNQIPISSFGRHFEKSMLLKCFVTLCCPGDTFYSNSRFLCLDRNVGRSKLLEFRLTLRRLGGILYLNSRFHSFAPNCGMPTLLKLILTLRCLGNTCYQNSRYHLRDNIWEVKKCLHFFLNSVVRTKHFSKFKILLWANNIWKVKTV